MFMFHHNLNYGMLEYTVDMDIIHEHTVSLVLLDDALFGHTHYHCM